MILAEFYYGSWSWAIWLAVSLVAGFVSVLLFANRNDDSDRKRTRKKPGRKAS